MDVVSGEGYHIETAIHSLKAPILSAEPQTRGFEQSLLLLRRDAGSGIAVACAATIAYFDKYGDATVAHDEVNLAAALADVGGDKAQTLALAVAQYYLPLPGGLRNLAD